MFGRKQKRIEELEAELRDALANLVNVTVQFPEPARASFRAAAARKGQWYRASAQFRVGDDSRELTDIFISESPSDPYFDGAVTSVEWSGDE